MSRTGRWVLAVAVAAGLAYLRAHQAWPTPVGADFASYVRAAHDVAAGRSPYGVTAYVYPPPVAAALAPFSHLPLGSLWKAWIVLSVTAPLGAAGAFVARRVRAEWRPLGLAACAATVLYSRYWPLGRILALGQTDALIFPFLTLAALAAPRPRGVLTGVTGLLKGWPAGSGLAIFQRGYHPRGPALRALVLTLVLAPVTALAFGWSGLTGMIGNVSSASQQHLVSDSVWGIPHLLFARTSLARPLDVSRPVQVLVTVLLAAWVIGLLVAALRTAGDPAVCTWNVTFCLILLLPVSHRQYALYVLPLLWWWAGRRRRIAFAIMLLWWLDQTVAWPYNGSSAAISSLRYAVPFFADVMACTASVLGARLLGRVGQGLGQGGVGQAALHDVAHFEVGRHR